MGLYAMWVPGSAAVGHMMTFGYAVEGGLGAYYPQLEGAAGFIGVNVPTPVIVDGRRMRLAKVILLYHAREAKLLWVAVYDGKRLLKRRDEWAVGDFSNGLSAENVLDFEEKPEVQFGIQIAIAFEPSSEGATGVEGQMLFAGFGADFVDGADPV